MFSNVLNKLVHKTDKLEAEEETEISEEVPLSEEGGWGWVVVASSMVCIGILDGIAVTFGSIMPYIVEDLQECGALIALINSIALSFYYLLAPVGSALINRFGFRTCSMTGSILCSVSYLITYFAHNYLTILTFYGVVAGLGYSLINLSCVLVVGYYFEKYRAIALSIASLGASIGISIFYPLNAHLVQISGWRIVILLHSAMFGLIYFFSIPFKPILSVAVVQTDPTRTNRHHQRLSEKIVQTNIKSETIVPNMTKRILAIGTQYDFPSSAQLGDHSQIIDVPLTKSQQSKMIIRVLNSKRTISIRRFEQIKSAISRMNLHESHSAIMFPHSAEAINGCCGRICTWENDIFGDCSLCGNDSFCEGDIQNLETYEENEFNATDVDTQYKSESFCSATEFLSSMMDTTLLKRPSFMVLCFHGFFIYFGLYMPYMFLQERNIHMGMPEEHCIWFVSVIGFSNMIGRLIFGMLAYKFDPLLLASYSVLGAGFSTCVSMLSFSVGYQYIYSFLFGFLIASLTVLRSMFIISLYGLEKLTHATGMIFVFQGVGALLCTPVASAIIDKFGFTLAFLVAGSSISLSGMLLLPAKFLQRMEDKNHNSTIKT